MSLFNIFLYELMVQLTFFRVTWLTCSLDTKSSTWLGIYCPGNLSPPEHPDISLHGTQLILMRKLNGAFQILALLLLREGSSEGIA